jgi:hypothetical protein
MNNYEKYLKTMTPEKLTNLITDGFCGNCPCKGTQMCDESGDCEETILNYFNRDEDYENQILRANILGGMDCYIRDLGDEDILEPWLMCGVPDGCSEEELMEIAEDVDDFRSIVKEFAKLI